MTIGERLKARLDELGMKQNELAKRLKISPSTLNGYFTDYREPDVNMLISLAEELKTSVEFLTTGKQPFFEQNTSNSYMPPTNPKLIELIKLAQGDRTQNEYALHCGLDSATLTKIIKGERNPKPDTLKKLSSRAHNDVTYNMLMQAAGYLEGSIKQYDPDVIDDEAHNQTIAEGSVAFGERLRLLREKANLTQSELALKLNVSTSAIGMYEQSRRKPDYELLQSIADYFEVTTDYLIGKTDNLASDANQDSKRTELNELMNAKNGVYFRLAKGAKDMDLDLDDDDVDFFLEFLKRGKKQ